MKRLVAGILVTAFLAAGCAHAFDATVTGVETTMASPGSAPADGEAFSITRKSVFGLWGAVSLSRPSLGDVIASQARGTQRVADLRIRVRSKFPDVLITVLTLGLIVPRSVTFEGVIVEQP